MLLLDPRNGPAFDLHGRGAPRCYVVASLPRTGSTLLCRALWDTGLVGAPSEYLNPTQIRDWEVRLGGRRSRLRHLPLGGPLLLLVGRGPWPHGRRRAYLTRILARRAGPSLRWFGLKVHRHHYARWFPGDDPEALLGPIRWIALTREDQVAQAVSWARALQTGAWAYGEPSLVRPRYSRALIRRLVDRIGRDEAAWERTFARRGVEPLRLTYEQLASDLAGAVRAALAYLDVPAPDALPGPALRRQADALSAAWIARYRG